MPVSIKKDMSVLASIKGSHVKVGYPEETSGKEEYSNGFTIANNALVQEKGNPNNRVFGSGVGPIPPRPFMSNGAESWQSDWAKNGAGRAFVESIKARSPGLYAESIGLSLKGFVQEAFTSNTYAKNSDLTIRKKGSSRPLINSGDLRKKVDYVYKVKP